MSRALPNLFVVGAMRSGTTSVHNWLDQHPDVHVSDPKEPHWFAFPDRAPSYTGPGDEQFNARTVWRRADYDALFAAGAAKRYRAESSAMYIHLPDAIDRLLGGGPDERDRSSRYVVIVRDPADRARSAYSYQVMRGREDASFADALRLEPERRDAGWSPMFWYVGAQRIADQVERLLREAPRSTLVLRYDDLADDSEGTAARLFEWLELDVPAGLDTTARNRSGEARSELVARMLAHGPVKARLKRILPGPLVRVLERAREANRTTASATANDTSHSDALDEAVFADERARLAAIVETHGR